MRDNSQAALAPLVIEDTQRSIHSAAFEFVDVRFDQSRLCPKVFIAFASMDVDGTPAMLDELHSGLRERNAFSEGAGLRNRHR